jgi:hypothetical protein
VVGRAKPGVSDGRRAGRRRPYAPVEVEVEVEVESEVGARPAARHHRPVDGWDEAEIDRAPICTWCGVTALPAESPDVAGIVFICENPDCDAYGEPV